MATRSGVQAGLAWWLLVAAVVVFSGCGGSRTNAPFRSPARDYPPPSAQTSDGEIVGVDRMAPDDRIRTQPTVGATGAASASPPVHSAAPPAHSTAPPSKAPPKRAAPASK